MFIVGYLGLFGFGKSYGVVENVIILVLEVGWYIIINILLKFGCFLDDFFQGKVIMFDNREVEDDFIFFDFERYFVGVIWIIDEVWCFWKSGMKVINIL